VAAVLASLPAAIQAASFVFADFNDTQGIIFNRDAATSSCVHLEETAVYGDHEGDADRREHLIGARNKNPSQCPGGDCELELTEAEVSSGRHKWHTNSTGSARHYLEEQGKREQSDEQGLHTEFVATETDDPGDTGEIGGRGTGRAAGTAGFGHRDEYAASKKTRCAGRVRLTPSGPSKRGSAWWHMPVPVTTGFETLFTFQVSDHSRECSRHRDPAFSTQLYESCATHGGDGLAFVLHRDPKGTEALGSDGRGLGYEGISNSLAVEFDTWFNPDTNTSKGGVDLVYDHVAVHSRGASEANSAKESAALAQQRPHPIGDGKVHLVKVTYVPFVAAEYADKFSATPQLVQYLKDNAESRRLGTLMVFVDDGVAQDDPLVALPINLSVLLELPQDMAYVGFTASTGLKWEKHDVLSWVWCDQIPCSPMQRQRFEKESKFDYAQHSKSAPDAAHSPRYAPGPGYGGVDSVDPWASVVAGGQPGGSAESTRNQSPDAPTLTRSAPHEHGSAFYEPRFHHSAGRDEGLLGDYGRRPEAPSSRESSTQETYAARDADAALQIPPLRQAPGYAQSPTGPSDRYLSPPDERFTEGTEIR